MTSQEPQGGQYPQYPQQPHGQGGYGQGGYGQGYPTPPQQPGNGLAIAGMVCGIVGLVIFNFILGPLAIIFGAVGLSRAKKGAKYRGQAIAGIVLGIVDIVIYVIIIAVVVENGGFVV